MDTLKGRRILVTGASSGIGQAVAHAIADAGGRVALLARSAGRLGELAGELGGAACPADVTDVESVRAAVAAAVDALGGLDGVVSSAGLALPSPMATADPQDWQRMFDVNVVGLLHVTQAVIPYLKDESPADVVNISSMSGRRRSSLELTVYAASKHAVHVISDGLREELRPDGIRVTVLAPGFVTTPIFEEVDDPATREKYARRNREFGLPVEAVAGQVVHALAQPADVQLFEVAMLSMRQG